MPTAWWKSRCDAAQRPPSCSEWEFGKILERHGWLLLRVSGSHHVYGKQGNPLRISVPVHGNAPLKRGLQRHLMKIAGIEDDEVR